MIERALVLFKAVVEDGGRRSLGELAAAQGIALSSAQRWVGVFERQGLLVPCGRGHRMAGAELLRIAEGANLEIVLRSAGRPFLRRFASAHRTTVHLGVWDGEMVTYLVKEATGPRVFTSEGMKLEGYCSAIGKVLLAHLPKDERDAYLAAGPFVALTDRTIVEPIALRRELNTIVRRGFAIDDHEVDDHLLCCAVPLRGHDGIVRAAISRSMITRASPIDMDPIVGDLSGLARKLAAGIFQYRGDDPE